MKKLEEKLEEILCLYNELESHIDGQLRCYNGIKLFPSEIHILSFIQEHQTLNVTEMAQKRKITKGALSKTISKLISKGLVIRYKHNGNNKNVYLKLTETGIIAYEGHQKYHQKRHIRYSDNMSEFVEKNYNILLKALEYINQDIKRYLDEVKKENSNPN